MLICTSRLVVVLTGLLLALQGPVCLAQSAGVPLSLRLQPFSASPRSAAPSLVSMTLTPNTSQLLEGELHLVVKGLGTTFLDLRVPGIVLSGSEYETTLVLPPLPSTGLKGLDVGARFVTADNSYQLSDETAASSDAQAATLLVTPLQRRGLCVAVVTSGLMTGPANRQLTRALTFETWGDQPPPPPGADLGHGSFATSMCHVRPDLLPANGLSLCAFDVVVLTDDGLSPLKERQLQALRSWVRAGGSLCVVRGDRLEARHAEFLTELYSEVDRPPTFLPDATGEWAQDADEVLEKASFGLGRVLLVAPTSADKTLSPEEARQLAGFVWRVRNEQLSRPRWAALKPERPAELGDPGLEEWERRTLEAQFRSQRPGAGVRLWHGPRLQRVLLPENVRMVPPELVAGLLAVYLMIVGPGEYFVLGLLKRRRYTWITFPIVTIGTTLLLVSISNHYLASTETGGRLQICDVASQGRIVRQSTIQLHFFGAESVVEHEWRNTMLASVERSGNIVGQYTRFSDGQTIESQEPAEFSGDASNLRYTGRIPTRYQTRQTIPQWMPLLTRSTQFTDEPAPDFGFDWDNPGDLTTPEACAELRDRLTPYGAEALVLHGDWETHSRLNPELVVTRPASRAPNVRDTIHSLTSAGAEGWFAWVSRVSPTGSGHLEDLLLLDESNPREVVLVIIRPKGNCYDVYRRVYTLPEPVPSATGSQDTDATDPPAETSP